MDEIGWRVVGDGAWLWVATNPKLSYYWVTYGRSITDAIETIRADFECVTVSDGWVVYNGYDKAVHQMRLAHLVRRCREMEADLPRLDRKVSTAAKAILTDALAAPDLDGPGRAAAAVERAARLDTPCARTVSNDANRRLLGHPARQAQAKLTFLTADADRGCRRHQLEGRDRHPIRRRQPQSLGGPPPLGLSPLI